MNISEFSILNSIDNEADAAELLHGRISAIAIEYNYEDLPMAQMNFYDRKDPYTFVLYDHEIAQ